MDLKEIGVSVIRLINSERVGIVKKSRDCNIEPSDFMSQQVSWLVIWLVCLRF